MLNIIRTLVISFKKAFLTFLICTLAIACTNKSGKGKDGSREESSSSFNSASSSSSSSATNSAEANSSSSESSSSSSSAGFITSSSSSQMSVEAPGQELPDDGSDIAKIAIAPITQDNVINSFEKNRQIVISGTVFGGFGEFDAGEFDKVTLFVGDQTYSGFVDEDGEFNVAVPGIELASVRQIEALLEWDDTLGNFHQVRTVARYVVDTIASATIRLNQITDGDVLNVLEVSRVIDITGSVMGDASEGDHIEIFVNENSYTGTLNAWGNFSIAVDGSDLQEGSQVRAEARGWDNYSNPYIAITTLDYEVDVTSEADFIIDPITGDNILDSIEAAQLIFITGTASGDASEGDTIEYTLNGTQYFGKIDAGFRFAIRTVGTDLAMSPVFVITLSGEDEVGNPFTSSKVVSLDIDIVAAASITVDDVTVDDAINAMEATQQIFISGSVGGDAQFGDTVTLLVNDQEFIGIVDQFNNFSLAVPGADLALTTSFIARVDGTDQIGNPFTAEAISNYHVDLTTSTNIQVLNITEDDTINLLESQQLIPVVGFVSGDAIAGDIVQLSINGNDYSGVVDSSNNFSIPVLGADLAVDTEFTVNVSGMDIVGNSFSVDVLSTHTVDLDAEATLLVDSITSDGVINASEANELLVVTGRVSGDASEGDVVSFSLNETLFTGLVNSQQAFNISVSGSDLAMASSLELLVVGMDDADNPYEARSTINYYVDMASSAEITVDAITSDNILNRLETTRTIPLTGQVSGDAKAGDLIFLDLGGENYSTEVDENNSFILAVPGSELALQTSLEISVLGEDGAGNSFTASVTANYQVDTTTSTGIFVSNVTADDIVNLLESEQTVSVMGFVSGDSTVGDVVSFTLNGNDYAGIVDQNNNFSIDVEGADLAVQTNFDIVVRGTDNAGNPFNEITTSEHTVDLTAGATLTVNPVTADNIVNSVEQQNLLIISGTVGGDSQVGHEIRLIINGKEYITHVGEGLAFAVEVEGGDLAAASSFELVLSGSDAAGNLFNESTLVSYEVDLESGATIDVGPITDDNIVNAVEVAMNIPVQGNVGGDAALGDSVYVVLNGRTYAGEVDSLGQFLINVPGSELAASTEVVVLVTGRDVAGNIFSQEAKSEYRVDTEASATVSVAPVTADNVVNISESLQLIPISGQVGGDAQPGDAVTLQVDATIYQSTVQQDLSYQVDVDGADLAQANSLKVSVTGRDDANNAYSTQVIWPYVVDTTTSTALFISNITDDDVLNASESTQTIAINGFVTGDAQAGDEVSFVLNGKSYVGLVDLSNNFSIDVEGSDLVSQTRIVIRVTGTDDAGNSFDTQGQSDHIVDLTASASITVDTVTSDNVINLLESQQVVFISGAVSGDAREGDIVSVMINGVEYKTSVESDLTYTVAIAGNDLVSDTEFTLSLEGWDDVGNYFNAEVFSQHIVDLESSASISLNNVTSDNVINFIESQQNILVTGTVAGDAEENDTITALVNGRSYAGLVGENSNFSLTIAGSDLALDAAFSVSVSGEDNVGNLFSASVNSSHSVDTQANASITVDPITADDTINVAESQSIVTVSGSVGGDATAGDIVSFTLNGNEYSEAVGILNTFSIDVSGADLANQTRFFVRVSGTDNVGNTFDVLTNSVHDVDLVSVANLVVGSVTPDNTLNLAESMQDIVLSGAVGGDAQDGDRVTALINGVSYEALVDANNKFSILVAGTDLAAQTSITFQLIGDDDVGNTFEVLVQLDYSVDTSVPAMPANQVLEYSQDSSANVPIGRLIATDNQAVIRYEFENGQGEFKQISEDGYYQINNQGEISLTLAGATPGVESNDSTVGDNIYRYGIVAIDSALNRSQTRDLELKLRLVFVKIANIDVTTDNTPTFYGLYSDVPGEISLRVNGQDYRVIKDGVGGWHITLSAVLAPGSYIATVSAANTQNDSDAFDVVAGSGIGSTLPVVLDEGPGEYLVDSPLSSFTVSAQNSANSALAYRVESGEYSTSPTYFYSAAGRDLVFAGNLIDYIYLGNSKASDGERYDDDIVQETASSLARLGLMQIDTASASNIVNVPENTNIGDVASGQAGNDIIYGEQGTDIIFGGDGEDILRGGLGRDAVRGGLGDDLIYGGPSADVLRGDRGRDIFFWEAGDEAQPDIVDNSSTDIVLDFSVQDDVLDLENFLIGESENALSLVNFMSFEFTDGDTFILLDLDGDGSGEDWQIRLLGVDLSGSVHANSQIDEQVISYLLENAALNTDDSTTHVDIIVDPITEDDVLNAAESQQVISVSGSVSGDAEPGDIVRFTINNTDYEVRVDVNRKYSIGVAGSDLAEQTSFLIWLEGQSDDGEIISASVISVHVIDLIADVGISVQPLTPDNILNAVESTQVINLRGHVTGDASLGDLVRVVVNSSIFEAEVDENSEFNVEIPGTTLAEVNALIVEVEGADNAGNSFNESVSLNYEVDTESSAILFVENITDDDILSPSEVNQIISVTGRASGDIKEGDLVSFEVNGAAYNGVLDGGHFFSVDVAGSDLAVDTEFVIKVSGEDIAGNAFIAEEISAHRVDMAPPTIPSGQVFDYPESRAAGDVIANIVANDNIAVRSFQFANGSQVSADGFYQIDDLGVISLTSVGAEPGVSNNEFEVGSNSYSYDIVAIDIVGNSSPVSSIMLNVLDDGAAPDDGVGEYIVEGAQLNITAYDPNSPSIIQFTEARSYNGDVVMETLEEFNVHHSNGIDLNSTYYLTDIDSGNSATWANLQVPVSGQYNIVASVASVSDGGVIAFDLNNGATPLGSIMVPNSGGHETWRQISLQAYLNSGSHTITMSAPSGGWNLDFIFFYPVKYLISTGAGRDWVEGGDGDEEIKLGDTAAIFDDGMPRVTAIDLAGTQFMSVDVDSLLDGFGVLLESVRSELTHIADVANAGGDNDIVFGEGGTDAIYGGPDSDKLYGGHGRDAVRGGPGDDLIIGGPSPDVLRGDSGADTFKWELGDGSTDDLYDASLTDIILDFNRAESDVLDLTELLIDEPDEASFLTQFIHLVDDGMGNTVLELDVDGDGNGPDWRIQINNLDLDLANRPQQAVLQEMLDSGSVIVGN